jgi:phosphoribosyl 1,2-cyclic phosphodiesterase
MMLIKLYGTRGSIPVSSRSIRKYGGNTTCLYVESENGDSIIVDAGSGIRDLGLYLTKNNKSKLNLLFTHYHWDHMQGMPFFIPIFLKNSGPFPPDAPALFPNRGLVWPARKDSIQ